MNHLKLLRGRNYLRGSDIYSHYIKKNFKDIKIEFKKKIKNQPDQIDFTVEKKPKNFSCIIEYKKNKKKFKLYLTNSKKKIDEQYDYDDKEIYKYFKIYKNSASCNFKSNLSSIDVLVALNKFYNNKKIKFTTWYFVRLKLTKALDNNILKKYTIKIKNKILDKFTVMSVYKDKKKIGEIEYLADN